MPHKFKIGDIVHYRPKDRMLNAARGTYAVTWLMPSLEGQQPDYRIKHLSEDFERVALENELTRGTLNMAKDDDPHAPYKVYEVTQPAPRPGERNSDSNDAAPLRRSVKNETPKMAAGDSGPK